MAVENGLNGQNGPNRILELFLMGNARSVPDAKLELFHGGGRWICVRFVWRGKSRHTNEGSDV